MDNNLVSIKSSLTPANLEHLLQVYKWFDSEYALTSWGGPGFYYPMPEHALVQAVQLDEVPTFVWLDEHDEVIGFGQCSLRLNRLHLGRLAVSPDKRGKGGGGRFISMLIALAQEMKRGADCSLFVYENNHAARRCYEKLGFEYQDYPEPLDEKFEGCLYMVLPAPQAL